MWHHGVFHLGVFVFHLEITDGLDCSNQLMIRPFPSKTIFFHFNFFYVTRVLLKNKTKKRWLGSERHVYFMKLWKSSDRIALNRLGTARFAKRVFYSPRNIRFTLLLIRGDPQFSSRLLRVEAWNKEHNGRLAESITNNLVLNSIRKLMVTLYQKRLIIDPNRHFIVPKSCRVPRWCIEIVMYYSLHHMFDHTYSVLYWYYCIARYLWIELK